MAFARRGRASPSRQSPPTPTRRASLAWLLGEPLLHCHQLTEDESGQPIESCDMVYRGDRYRFRASLVRPAPPPGDATAGSGRQPRSG